MSPCLAKTSSDFVVLKRLFGMTQKTRECVHCLVTIGNDQDTKRTPFSQEVPLPRHLFFFGSPHRQHQSTRLLLLSRNQLTRHEGTKTKYRAEQTWFPTSPDPPGPNSEDVSFRLGGTVARSQSSLERMASMAFSSLALLSCHVARSTRNWSAGEHIWQPMS